MCEGAVILVKEVPRNAVAIVVSAIRCSWISS